MPTASRPVLTRQLASTLAWLAAAALVTLATAIALVLPRTSGGVRVAVVAGMVALVLGVWLLLMRRTVHREVAEPLARAEQAGAMVARVDKLATTGRLAAGVAHEVGNPLAAIATYAHLIRQRSGNDPALADPLDGLEREVARIDRIVSGLLDYARPRRQTPKAVVVDDVLRDVLQLVADQGVLRRITLTQDMAAGTAAVFAERHDLEQLFVNVVLNAVEAMKGEGQLVVRSRAVPTAEFVPAAPRRASDTVDGSFPRRVQGRAEAWLARTDRAEAVLQVVVADSGPGFPDGMADALFEPFFTTKDDGRGTGLGLAIVAQTVEGAGGTIWAQPAREGGAAFVLLLPVLGNSSIPPASD